MRRTLLGFLVVLAFAAPATAGNTREARGVLTATPSTAVTLRSEHGTLACRVGERSPSLDGFAAGDYVSVVCARTRDRWLLVRIRHLAAPKAVPASPAAPTASPTFGGTVTAVSPAALTVRDGDHSLTCFVGSSSPSVADLAVGDHVRIACASGVLSKLERVSVAPPMYGSGTVVAVSAEAIAVQGEHDLRCTLGPHSPSAAEVHVGDHVKLACIGGVLVQLARVDAPPPVAPPVPSPAATLSAAGAISALESGSLSVHGEHDVTCTLTDASPRLGDFHLGDRVRIDCTNGVLVSIARL